MGILHLFAGQEADLEDAEMRADRVEERLAEYLRQCVLGNKGNDPVWSFLKIPESVTREAQKGGMMQYTKVVN